MNKKLIAIAILPAALTLGGCATVSKEDLAEVRALAEKAAADASEAKTMAADAGKAQGKQRLPRRRLRWL